MERTEEDMPYQIETRADASVAILYESAFDRRILERCLYGKLRMDSNGTEGYR